MMKLVDRIFAMIKRLCLTLKKHWRGALATFSGIVTLAVSLYPEEIKDFLWSKYHLTIEPINIAWHETTMNIEYSLSSSGNVPIQINSQYLFRTFHDQRNQKTIKLSDDFKLIPNDPRKFSATETVDYWDRFDMGDTTREYLSKFGLPVSTLSFFTILSYKADGDYYLDTIPIVDVQYYQPNDPKPVLKKRLQSKQIIFPR